MATTQLQALVESAGPDLVVGSRSFKVGDFLADGDGLALAEIASARTVWTGMLLPRSRVAGRAGAEVWSVMRHNGSEVFRFAVHEGALLSLA